MDTKPNVWTQNQMYGHKTKCMGTKPNLWAQNQMYGHKTKCMDTEPNFTYDFSDDICDEDLVAENKILKVKLEEADKKSYLRGEVKDFTALLNANIKTFFRIFKI